MHNTGLFYIVVIWIFRDAHVLADQNRCEPLFMCPTFCMKMKNGCYVCNCGNFSDYLKKSANEMSRVSNEQSPQTGSQLSTYTSGYDVEKPQQTGTGTGFVDYRTMFRSVVASNRDRNFSDRTGLDDDKVQNYLFQNGGSLNPDFTRFSQIPGPMPGMSCVAVSRYCPASCLTTDVYTGCIQCRCNVLNNAVTSSSEDFKKHKPTDPIVSTLETKPHPPTRSPWQIELRNTLIPFKVPTPAPLHLQQKIPTPLSSTDSVGLDQLSNPYHGKFPTIKIPTLPPDPTNHTTKIDLHRGNFINHELYSDMDKEHETNQQPRRPTATGDTGGGANLDHIYEQKAEHSPREPSAKIFASTFNNQNDVRKQENHTDVTSSTYSAIFRSGLSAFNNNKTNDRKYETVAKSNKTMDGDNPVNMSKGEVGTKNGSPTTNYKNKDIFEFLNEVIDNNEMPTGGFYGNVINKGLSLQELTHIRRDNEFNS